MIEVRAPNSDKEVSSAIGFLDELFAGNQGWYANCKAILAAVKVDPALIMAAFEDGNIIGVAVFDGKGVVNGIGVYADYRRRGLGRLLLGGIEQAARSRGCRRITLGSVNDATDFYLACGYKATLLVQFRTGESDLHARVEQLSNDLLKAYAVKQAEWEGRPQLFVQTNGVDWDLKQRVEKFDPAVVCQFIMGKDI